MGVGLEVGIDDLVAVIEGSDERIQLDSSELDEIANAAIQKIDARTVQGIDYRGDTFEYYSGMYARYRALQGRQVERVDMTFDGQMLAALTARSSSDAAIVRFTNATEARKAMWHHEGAGHLPAREWFDIQQGGDEARELAEMAVRFMARKF